MRRQTLAGLALAIALGTLSWPALASATGARAPLSTPRLAAAADSGLVSGRPALTADAGRTQLGLGVDTQRGALERYWTAQRMRAAISADDLPSVRTAAAALRVAQTRKAAAARTATTRGLDTAAIRPDGPATRVNPVAPTVAEPSVAARSSLGARLESYNPGYPVGHPVARTYGKVFFTNQTNHLNYVCSATVVNSEGRDTVWTAGHCVHGGAGGTWHANWTFAPNYHNGVDPYYGLWTANQLWTRTAWASSSDLTEDMGVAIMNTRNGYHIVNYTGGQGIAWNYSKNYYAYDFGYPQAPPFDGTKLIGCVGTTFPEWVFLWWSADTIGLHCDMTGGASGGAWLRWFDGNWGYINGLNSYKYDNDPNTIYSPYFDNAAASLYNAVRNL
jgi:hypothetical protein